LGREFLHLPAERTRLRLYLQSLRPRDWLANLTVFLPVNLAGCVNQALVPVLACCVALCLVTSGFALARPLLGRHSGGRSGAGSSSPPIPIAHATLVTMALIPAGLGVGTGAGALAALVVLIVVTVNLADERAGGRHPTLLGVMNTLLRLGAGVIAAGLTGLT
jgi:hypothetical protein